MPLGGGGGGIAVGGIDAPLRIHHAAFQKGQLLSGVSYAGIFQQIPKRLRCQHLGLHCPDIARFIRHNGGGNPLHAIGPVGLQAHVIYMVVGIPAHFLQILLRLPDGFFFAFVGFVHQNQPGAACLFGCTLQLRQTFQLLLAIGAPGSPVHQHQCLAGIGGEQVHRLPCPIPEPGHRELLPQSQIFRPVKLRAGKGGLGGSRCSWLRRSRGGTGPPSPQEKQPNYIGKNR